MASRNVHPTGKPTGLSPADLSTLAEPAAYLTTRVATYPLSLLLQSCGLQDNAVAESFFAAIKRALTSTRRWPAFSSVRRAVFERIEG